MNFLPAQLEGDTIKLPFGDAPLPDAMRSVLEGGDGKARDVIAGVRPEHFEDADVEPDKAGPAVHRAGRRRRVDGLRALRLLRRGARRTSSPPSSIELAEDAGLERPADATAAGTSSRSSPGSTPRAAHARASEVELVLDTQQIQLFDPSGGKSLVNQRGMTETTLPATGPA